ncbi:hypothetical protein J6Q66_07310 [bacterium]|nr:hypothetical protein [bacterium]
MFPGFILVYKDENEFIHLYFFKGIDDNGKDIYKNIDLSKIPCKYSEIKNIDGSFDYKFENKKISQISCKLVPYDQINHRIEIKTLKVK